MFVVTGANSGLGLEIAKGSILLHLFKLNYLQYFNKFKIEGFSWDKGDTLTKNYKVL